VAVVRTLLLSFLLLFACALVVMFVRMYRARGQDEPWGWPGPQLWLIGFATDFLDTLGIGSFATTTALLRALRALPDRLLPGTLNVGHALPTVLQALIYIAAIEIDVGTLIALIAASMLGAYLGAGLVSRLSERGVRLGVGCALVAAAALLLARLYDVLPPGSDSLELCGFPLALGVAGNFVLGALMTLGIGLYAPCMILVSLLGMNPKAAFPIMMGSCAFLMLVAAPRFIRERGYALRPALGLTLGGLPGVWIAAEVVKELNLTTVRWLVLFVVIYTAVSLLRAARRSIAPRSEEPVAGGCP
jgi:uncharacterized membrane protein YfcA